MKSFYPKNPPQYASVSKKILLTFVIVSFLPLAIITASVVYQSHLFYREKVKKPTGIFSETSYSKHRYLFTGTAQRYSLSCDQCARFEELKDEQFLQEMLKKLQCWVWTGFFGSWGRGRKAVGSLRMPGPFGWTRPIIQGPNGSNRPFPTTTYVSDVFLGLRGLPHFNRHHKKGVAGKAVDTSGHHRLQIV